MPHRTVLRTTSGPGGAKTSRVGGVGNTRAAVEMKRCARKASVATRRCTSGSICRTVVSGSARTV